jgi:copper chaperone
MQFHVQGMTCSHCVRSITRSLQGLDPGARVEVDLAAGQVTADGRFSPEQAVAAIEAEGYTATPVTTPTDSAQAPSPGCCGGCHG